MTSLFPQGGTSWTSLPVIPEERYNLWRQRGHIPASVTRAQLAVDLSDGGPANWPIALHLLDNPDQAFQLTYGGIPDRKAKTRIYAAVTGMPESFVEQNFDFVERKGIKADPRELRRRYDESVTRAAELERQRPFLLDNVLGNVARLQKESVADESKMQDLAKMLDRPVDEIRANPGLAATVWAVEKARKDLAEADKTISWLQDPRNLNLMGDELRFGAQLESMLISKHGSWVDKAMTSFLATASHFGTALASTGLAGREVTNAITTFLHGSPAFNPEGVQEYADAIRQVREQTVQLTEDAGGAGRFAADVVAGMAQMTGWMALAAAHPALSVAVMGFTGGGNIYGESRDAGSPVWQALGASILGGISEAALEQAQLKGVSRLAGLKSAGAVSAGRIMADIVSNAGQEWAQSLTGQVSSFLGELGAPGRVDRRDIWEQIQAAAGEGLYEGAVAGIAATLFLGFRIPGLVGQARQLAASKEMHTRLAAGAKIAEQMNLGQTPDAMEELVETITAGEVTSNAAVDAQKMEEWFATQPREVKEAMLGELGIEPGAFEKAVEDGREVEFKYSAWLAKIAKTELGVKLVKNLRVGDLLTVEEYAEAEKALVSQLDELQKVTQEFAAAKEKTPAEILKFREKLKEYGMSGSAADDTIALLQQGLLRFAGKRGETLAQIVQRTGLELVVSTDRAVFVTEEQAKKDGELLAASKRLRPKKVNPAILTRAVESESGYVYHATNEENLIDIVRSRQLETHGPSFGTDQEEWPDGGTEDRAYFSQNAGIVWTFAPVEGKPVIIRTKIGPGLKRESGTRDIYSQKPISTDQLEYLGEDGQWHSLVGEAEEFFAKVGDEILGKFVPGKGKFIIELFKGSVNKPTVVLHEIGHLFLQMHQDLVKDGLADEQATQDLAVLEQTFGDLKVRDNVERLVDEWISYLSGEIAPAPQLVSAFRRFARWIRRIYAQLRMLLGSEINPAVKEVFDHWLATENEIEAAEAYYQSYRSAGEMLNELKAPGKPRRGPKKEGEAEEPKDAGQADPKWAAAQDRLDAARAAARQSAEEELDREAQKRAKEWLKLTGGRAALVSQVEADLRATGPYRALTSILEAGGIGEELLDSLQNQTAPGLPPGAWAEALRRWHGQRVVSANGFTDRSVLEALSGETGFSNAVDLVKALMDTKPLAEAVKEEADSRQAAVAAEFRRTLELTQGVSEIGQSATHNDRTLAFLLADISLLSAQTESKKRRAISNAEVQAIRDRLRAWLNTMPIEQAKRYKIWASREATEARAVFAAAKSGDVDAAYDARRRQLNYHLLMLEAIEREKWLRKFLRRYSASKLNLDRLPDGIRQTVQDILSTYWIRTTSAEGADGRRRRVPIAPPVGAMSNRLIMPEDTLTTKDDEALLDLMQPLADLIPDWVMAKERVPAESVEQMSYRDMVQLDDVLQALVDEGRGVLAELAEQDAATVAEFVAKAIGPMQAQKARKPLDQSKFWSKWILGPGRRAEAFTAKMEMLLELLDGNPLLRQGPMGILHKAFRRGATLLSKEEVRLRELFDGPPGLPGLKGSFDTLAKQLHIWRSKFGGDHVVIDGFPVPEAIRNSERGWQEWPADAVIAMALNLGRDVNLHALQSSEYGITDEQIEALKGMFTADSVKAIQDIWTTVGSLYPEIATSQWQMRRQRVVKEKGQPLAWTTAEGTVLQLEGGYYPLIFDPLISDKAASRANKEEVLDRMSRDAVFSSHRPPDGHTKAVLRDKDGNPVSTQPPLLTTGLMLPHIRRVLHLAYTGPWLKDMVAVAKNPDFRKEFVRVAGADLYRAMRKWLNYVARPDRRNSDFGSVLASTWTNRFTTATLGLRFFTGVKQRLSIYNGINALTEGGGDGAAYFAKGVKFCGMGTTAIGTSTQDVLNFITGKSLYLRNRANAIDRDLYNARADLRRKEFAITVNGKKIGIDVLHKFTWAWIQMNDWAVVAPLWTGAYFQFLERKAEGMEAEAAEQAAIEYADAIIATSQPSGLPIDLSELQRREGFLKVITLFMTWRQTFWNRIWAHGVGRARGDQSTAQSIRFFLTEICLPAWTWVLASALFIRPDKELRWYDFFTAPISDVAGTMPLVAEAHGLLRYRRQPELPMFEGINRAAEAAWAIQDGEVGRASVQFVRTIEWFFGLPLSNLPLDVLRTYYRQTGQKVPKALRD